MLGERRESIFSSLFIINAFREENQKMKKILLIDTSREVRGGLQTLLELEPDFTILCSSPNIADYLKTIPTVAPDIIIMDFVMPESAGVEHIQQLTSLFPEVGMIILTINDTPDIKEMAHAAGAYAFISKFEGIPSLLAAARCISNNSSQSANTET
jgi:DNA-binding NarL/FixJ family response regulator